MEEKNWIYMMERMQDIRVFSRTLIKRATKEYSMPSEHLDLLSQLALKNEKMTPMALSKTMNVNKTIISRIIDQLNTKGYLIKTKDENDKRSYFVSITVLGKSQIDNIYKHYLGPIYQLREKLGDDDFFNLMEIIEKANKEMINDTEGE